ncbi:hypothetical protein SANTM175S_07772 [Streptomyces antimycoticus]
MTFDSINISSSQALVRPSSPQLLVELLTSLPDVVERAPRLISPIHGDRSITEVRRLATSIAALGTETVARGVESEPEAADLLRAAAMFLADRSDGIEIETMCRDIALGITTLQDVESPCHSAVRGLRVRVAWPSGAHQEDHLACWDDAVRAGRAGSRAAHSRRVLAGLRTVAIDGTSLHLPDSEPIASRHTKRKRKGEDVEFGYPLLRLLTLIECGTRAVLAAAFGPETHRRDHLRRAHARPADPRNARAAGHRLRRLPLLLQLRSTGAEFLCRSGSRRIPLITKRLPDGSYLSTFGMGKLPVRIVEAWITVTYQDGTVRREQWRLATSLTDHTRYPARELVTLYHERWQAETTYFSIKATMLDGRILRSHRPEEVDQEVYALLTVYQALIRITADATTSRPSLDPDRISFTIAPETARDQVTTAAGIIPREVTLVGTIGYAILDNLLPARRRQRTKARTRKNPTSKYSKNSLQHPAIAQYYALEAEVTVMEEGLKARSKH